MVLFGVWLVICRILVLVVVVVYVFRRFGGVGVWVGCEG